MHTTPWSIDQAEILNDHGGWNCQDYVQGILLGLVVGGALDVGAVETALVELEQCRGEMADDFADAVPERDSRRILC